MSKKKNEQATFLEDVKDHIDEFINASMDEHKSCFKKTIQKMFGMSKIVAERSSETKEVKFHKQQTLFMSIMRFCYSGNVSDGFHLMGDHLKALVLLKYVDFSTSMMMAMCRKGL
ncbi:hypothetical protein CFP56_006825 [Quercus suber]|uniref:BTB/POZ domain-containing protein n=1 Tax=Quercus suber TaxID=58331 RepID=A0AAW0M986_QUESU